MAINQRTGEMKAEGISYYEGDEVRAYRVRQVHFASGSRSSGTAQRHQRAGRRTPQTGRTESESSGAEAQAEDQEVFRLGPRFNRSGLAQPLLPDLARDFFPRQALANNLANGQIKAVAVIHSSAVVEAESLFIDVPEEVVWFDADIGPSQSTFKQAPEVLQPVGVNVTRRRKRRGQSRCAQTPAFPDSRGESQ